MKTRSNFKRSGVSPGHSQNASSIGMAFMRTYSPLVFPSLYLNVLPPLEVAPNIEEGASKL